MIVAGIFLLTFLSPFSQATATTNGHHAAICQPYKIPVDVDAPDHKFQPYKIEMHRCLGQCRYSSPQNCECAPAPGTEQSVSVTVGSAIGSQTIQVKNHTKCQPTCKASYKKQCIDGGHNWDERACACQCPTPGSSTQCGPNQTWDSASCRCVCNNQIKTCRFGRTWNKSLCECQCKLNTFARCARLKKLINLRTCKCEDRPNIGGQVGLNTDESQTKLVAALVVIGLLLGMLFVIDLFLMSNKKGFMYGLVTKCKEEKDTKEFTADQGDSGSTCISIDNSFTDHKLKGTCKHKTGYLTDDSGTDV